jgi:hypothetical protein
MLVRVESDPGAPLAGVAVLVDGAERGTTGEDGRARLSLVGVEGDMHDVSVRCPAGFQSPAKPISAPLHRIADPAKMPEYSVLCPPLERKVIVAVRAENGPNLPVRYLDNEVARTDASGSAHVELSMRPGDSFELTLSTTEPGNEKLRPRSPSAPFTARAQDDILVFDQQFTREKDPVRRIAAPARPRHL